MPRWAVWCCSPSYVGCSSTTERVGLDTGRGKPRVHVPPSGGEPVAVDDEEFHQDLVKQARTVRTAGGRWSSLASCSVCPSAAAGTATSARAGVCCRSDAADESDAGAFTRDAELNRLYILWCGRIWGPPPGIACTCWWTALCLDGDGKYALAMAIAQGAVLGEMKNTFGQMVNPEAVAATMTGAMTMYLMLWLLPEPISEGRGGADDGGPGGLSGVGPGVEAHRRVARAGGAGGPGHHVRGDPGQRERSSPR